MKTKEDFFGDGFILDPWDTFDKKRVKELFGHILEDMERAEKAGFTQVQLEFAPMRDSSGYNSGMVVEIKGLRPLTEHEIAEELVMDRISELAKSLGVSSLEAATIFRLKQEGKIKL